MRSTSRHGRGSFSSSADRPDRTRLGGTNMPRTCPRRRGHCVLASVLVLFGVLALLAPASVHARDAVKKPAAKKDAKEAKKPQRQAGNSFLWKVTSADGDHTAYLL